MPVTLQPTLDRGRVAADAPPQRRLALVAPERDWRIELDGTPQTIGSGPRCTVRLDAPGLRPLHCVITPTASGAVVRRWAEGTELNGKSFEEADLAAGDTLRVGGVSLRVVDAIAAPVEACVPLNETSPSPVTPEPAAEACVSEPQAVEAPGWTDDSFSRVEVAKQPATSETSVEEFDPAIPSRLLRPWTPAQGSAVATPPVVEAVVEAAPFALSPTDPAIEPTSAVAAPSRVEAFANEEASIPLDGVDAFAAPMPSDDPWRVELGLPQAAPNETFDAAAALAFAAEPAAPVLDAVPIAPVGAGRERLAAARRRVRGLVEALRAERQRVAAWQLAVEERDRLINSLESQLAAAMESAQLAAAELALRVEAEASSPRATDVVEEPVPAWFAAETPAAEEGFREQPVESRFADSQAEEAWQALEVERDAADFDSPRCWTSGDDQPAEQPERVEVEAFDADSEAGLWGIERLGSTVDESKAEAWPHPTIAPETAPETAPVSVELVRALAEEPAVFADAVDLHGGPEAAMGVEPPATGRTDESEEAPAQRRSESPSFIERFAHLVPEDGEPVAAPEAPHREPASSAPRGSSDEDDSIDEYMRKLMERVRGSNETPSAPVERVKPSAVEPSVAGAAPEAVEAVALAPSPEPVGPLKDLSEIRRLPSREVTTDLGALRQLANQSARQAIDVAQTRQSRERASLRLVLSCVSLGCGALAAITASSPFGAQFVGGVLAAAGGGWFGVRTLRSCQTASVKAEHDALASSDR